MALSTDHPLQAVIASIPHAPGVYQYLDESGKVIYVGKAKDLRKRVGSYFVKEQTGKVRVLVKRIRDIRVIVVSTESEALLLENTLIKELQPRYNILLKDDKTYPWICIKKEAFSRVFSTRNRLADGSEYFGPYASGRMMKTLLELIKQLYTIRNCSLNLSEQAIRKGSYKVCLEYHIGNCKGPCEGFQNQQDYDVMIGEIRQIIKGNIQGVLREMKGRMMQYAELMEFEKAQQIKEKLAILENYKSKSTVVSDSISNVDVFSLLDEADTAWVNYIKVVEGAVVQSHSVEVKKKLDETADEILRIAIVSLRQRLESNSPELILPFEPDDLPTGLKVTVPQRGEKKHLLELSENNARHFKMETEKQRSLVDPERHTKRILQQLQKDLRMNVSPEVIECFDNSNFQGDYAVAAMVQFKNAKPNKSEYRHFNIKTVEGPNDFASMEEIIERRYSRLMKEEKPLPQLIIVDGGKGQLAAAVKSLDKLGLRGKITIVGIAKRLEEIYYPGDSIPIYIDKKSESLKVIQFLRDEAHRFGITHHRKKFEKGFITSEFSKIKGIGENTAQKLLLHFKSFRKVSEATDEELQAVVGLAKTKILRDYFTRSKDIIT
ncbi:MAG TPA: excinuclease ABC subunit UvrC [Bacteroidales bacterium]|nr:excinuclease ABC subunit UvrC [Bacteroidales bacterium]HQQ12158.1 excinuclease ABC subunit UvrC [Bacteroidales bacterium]